MTTLLLSHPACLEHATPPGHPERPDRMRAVEAALSADRFNSLQRDLAPEGTLDAVALCHNEHYIEELRHVAPTSGLIYLDGDTSMSPGTWEAVMRAVGGAVAATDAVMTGGVDNAFVATRPPGHHAEIGKPMGFCFFDHAAIAARHAQRKYGVARVAVVDFDVHHGNGTQDILGSDPDMLYVSSHQWPCYPGTGASEERGVADNVLNLPLPPGATGPDFRRAWERNGLPAVDVWAPELLIVSAGFDAHRSDPLAELRLDTEDFGWMTDQLLTLADTHCGGRLVSVLEGGYDLNALAASAALHVRRLMRQ